MHTDDEALALFDPIAETLSRAHALGIVHRDLKPANVFLSRDPGRRVRLMDFGFAKFGHLRSLTADGFVAGSPSYLSPEAWGNKPVTPSMDVYGFGAMIFRVFAGPPPFVGKHPIDTYKLCTSAPGPACTRCAPTCRPAWTPGSTWRSRWIPGSAFRTRGRHWQPCEAS
ncbi:MAG: protein kinase [Sandaracinaceae bacterium]|nr:protein kinase [Sandaracinaceae bacterium]